MAEWKETGILRDPRIVAELAEKERETMDMLMGSPCAQLAVDAGAESRVPIKEEPGLFKFRRLTGPTKRLTIELSDSPSPCRVG